MSTKTDHPAPVDGAAALAEIVRANAQPETLAISYDGCAEVPAIVLPRDQRLVSVKALLDEYRERPERIEGTATLQTLDAFLAHVARFGAHGSAAIFADGDLARSGAERRPSLTACYDYHPREAEPAWDRHRALYHFPLSDEWRAWAKFDGAVLSTQALGELIEDRIEDLHEPPQADDALGQLAAKLQGSFASVSRLVELGKGLRVHVKSQVHDVMNRETGEADMVFKTEHQAADGSRIAIPSLFLIAIPVFAGGPLYRLACRLRYRVVDNKVAWIVTLYRPDRSFDHAFDEAVKKVAADTGLPVFQGTPEAPQPRPAVPAL